MKKSKSRKNKEWRRRKALKDILSRNRDMKGNINVKHTGIIPLTKAERKTMNNWGIHKKKTLFGYRSITKRKLAVENLDKKLVSLFENKM